MARLSELNEWERELMLIKLKDLTPLGPVPWVTGAPLNRRRVAIITSAGIHRKGDVRAGDLVMSHLSSNFDRTVFQQDINVVFPIDRLHALAADGVIGSVAAYHYAFNGSTPTPRAARSAGGGGQPPWWIRRGGA